MVKIFIAACAALAVGILAAVMLQLSSTDNLQKFVPPVDETAKPLIPRFKNVADSIKLSTPSNGPVCSANAAGAAWMDLDHKGSQELMLSSYSGWNMVWSVSAQKADPLQNLGLIKGATGLSVADYNNDGWDDILVSTQSGPRLYRNYSGRLKDVTAGSGLKAHKLGMSAAWGDLNRDGLLDLVLVQGNNCVGGTSTGFHFGQMRLYAQASTGKFVNSDRLLKPVAIPALGMAAAWTDLNNDGWLDLYLANDDMGGIGNQAWLNKRGRLVQSFRSAEISINSMGIGLGDTNRDQRMDLAISNIEPMNLLLNRRSGFSRKRLSSSLTTHLPITWGSVVEDFNNDGWEDVFSSAGGIEGAAPDSQVFYLNRGDRYQITDYAAQAGLDGPHRGRAVATTDLNRDGNMDAALASLNGQPALYINQGAARQGHWLQVALTGNPSLNSPSSACGARAWVTAGKLRLMREVDCGSEGFASSSDRALHFGLGKEDQTVVLKVRWPGGQMKTYRLQPDRRYNISQQAK
jgi:hypothetical protein